MQPSPRAIWALTALQVPRVGVATVRKLLRQYSHEVPTESLQAAMGRWQKATDDAVRVLEACRQHGIDVLAMGDDAYPERLETIDDAPPVIYVRGSAASWRGKCVAVVGTRKCSPDGADAAFNVARALGSRGFVVVSGLALGIDARAHEGAIAASAPTVAVMAHGLHTVSPKSNSGLADSILRGGGALIAEHPPGFPARPAEFVRRNRIQSGMSVASVIIESGREGGAIHQANFTRQQGRDLYVVRSRGEGSGLNMEGADYLQQSVRAVPVYSTSELVQKLGAGDGRGRVMTDIEQGRFFDAD